MDLRTRQLFRILIPFLNVSNDNGTFPAIPADALPDVSVSDCQGTAIICGNASCTLSVSSYRKFPPVSERTPRDFSCSYRGGRKRINGRHRKEAICHDSCQRIYDRYGTLSFFSYCNRPDLCHASGRSSTGNTTKAFCYSTDRSVFSADAPIHIHLSAVYADFSKCRYSSVDSSHCTRRVFNQCRCCRRRYQPFCREQFSSVST